MVDVVMKRNALTGTERPQEKDFNERKKVVRVLPRNDLIRRYLKHGVTKVGFLASGSAEWPMDQFTRNRIRDGDVTIERAERAEQRAPAEKNAAPTRRRVHEAPTKSEPQ